MARRRGLRPWACAQALAFALAGAGAALGFVPCPQHRPPARAAPSAPGGHAHHGHGPAAPDRPADPTHACTCVGTCHSGAATPLVVARPAHTLSGPADRRAIPRPDDRGPSAPPAFLLPYALAPPTA